MHYHFVALDKNGKPFRAHGETIRRHYTTTNCLEKIQYKGFMKLLRSNGFECGDEKVEEERHNDNSVLNAADKTET